MAAIHQKDKEENPIITGKDMPTELTSIPLSDTFRWRCRSEQALHACSRWIGSDLSHVGLRWAVRT